MNKFFKQINILLFCIAIALPLYATENKIGEQQTSQVWYKKRSVRIGAAVTTAAVFALAMRMGKIALPTFLASLFVTTVAQNPVHESKNDTIAPENNTVIINDKNIDNKDDEQVHISAEPEIPVNNAEPENVPQQTIIEKARLHIKAGALSFKDNFWNSIKNIQGKDLQGI